MVFCNVWAAVSDAMAPDICEDARLRERRETLSLLLRAEPSLATDDRVWGQAGWDIGVRFRDFYELSARLRTLSHPESSPRPGARVERGSILRLAINAHGEHGRFFVAGQRRESAALRLESIEHYMPQLDAIRSMTREGSLVYSMGCNLAASPSGEELIRRLSGGVWRGRFVVAFRHRG